MGFYQATREGMILDWVQLYTPNWLASPVYNCITCMASVHSLYVFLPFALHHGICLWSYIPYILALAGLNTMVMALYSYLSPDDDERNEIKGFGNTHD